jgi:hypothetical protein
MLRLLSLCDYVFEVNLLQLFLELKLCPPSETVGGTLHVYVSTLIGLAPDLSVPSSSLCL